MIKYITGDLVKDSDKFDVLVHGCNCFCTMNSGIAPQIKHKFPEAYEVDCMTNSGDINKLGRITFTRNTTPIIVNSYTQFRYGRDKMHVDYDALRKCMITIKLKFSGKKIGMPKIGAGLAGGDWGKIEKIINDALADEDVTVVIWNK